MKFNTQFNASTTIVTEAGSQATFSFGAQAQNEGIIVGAEISDVKFGAVSINNIHVERAYSNNEICDFEERVVNGAKEVLSTGRELLDRLRQRNQEASVHFEVIDVNERITKDSHLRVAVTSHASDDELEVVFDVLSDLNVLHKAYEAVMSEISNFTITDLSMAIQIPALVSRVNGQMDSIYDMVIDKDVKMGKFIDMKEHVSSKIVRTLELLKRIDEMRHAAAK